MPFFEYQNRKVYYREIGSGQPLILLHGNTASSNMFDEVIDLYQNDFRVILIDFLGHGQSDRLPEFPVDLWFDEALQVIRLIECKKFGKVHLIGVSGGALVALNAALERGDLVNKMIADSFEGERSLDVITDTLFDERAASKTDTGQVAFWTRCHGQDWERVVDCDTSAAVLHGRAVKRFFHKDLSELSVPALFTASRKDELAAALGLDFFAVYGALAKKVRSGTVHLFQNGKHPAMLSNAPEFAALVKEFFKL